MGKRHTGGLEEYSEDFLDCRESHEWHWVTDWNILRGPGGRLVEFTRTRECGRCKTLAQRTYDGRTGRVIRASYSYADGYLTRKDNKIDAGRARLEMLRRAGRIEINENEEDQ